MIESGQASAVPTSKKHAAERSYRYMRRLGIAWKVKLQSFQFKCDDGSFLDVAYISPQAMLQYLVHRHPLVVFGKPTLEQGVESLAAFWDGYAEFHKSHVVFSSHSNDLNRVIPIAIHGDEGRGKRRSQTTVISFESILGCQKSDACHSCVPTSLEGAYNVSSPTNELAKTLRSNMKGHSYLQHWPLVVIPGVWAKNYKRLTDEFLQLFGAEFKKLFEEGFEVQGQRWFCAVVASKGDLKWTSQICKLSRGYERKGTKNDYPCCHLCLAGGEGMPAEDCTSQPCWLDTCFVERPWEDDNPPSLHAVPFDDSKPEFMYRHDAFHTLRLGLYRDLVASTIFLWLRWGLFGPQGTVDDKLGRAHCLFRMWCLANRKSASLRSFTKLLFNYKNKKSYPFANVKGSDVNLILGWIATMAVGFLNDGVSNEQQQVMTVILSTTRLAISFYKWIHQHGLFVGWSCGAVFFEKGQSMVNGYLWLAKWAFDNQMCLYGVKPKLHFLQHMLQEVKGQLNESCCLISNPVMNDCSQNEDLIGRVCKMSRKIDIRVMTKRSLEFYLVKASILLKRFEAERHAEHVAGHGAKKHARDCGGIGCI